MKMDKDFIKLILLFMKLIIYGMRLLLQNNKYIDDWDRDEKEFMDEWYDIDYNIKRKMND